MKGRLLFQNTLSRKINRILAAQPVVGLFFRKTVLILAPVPSLYWLGYNTFKPPLMYNCLTYKKKNRTDCLLYQLVKLNHFLFKGMCGFVLEQGAILMDLRRGRLFSMLVDGGGVARLASDDTLTAKTGKN